MHIPKTLKDTYVFFLCRACEILQDRANTHFKSSNEDDIGLRKRWLLLAIDDKPLTQRELCQVLNVNSNSMVEAIDDLEKRGYVSREENLANRRSNLITLSDKGKKLNSEWKQEMDRIFKQVLEPLTKSEMKQLKSLCEKIIESNGASFQVNL